MQPFAHALLETFALRRGALVEALSHIIHNNPHQEPGVIYPADLEHLLDAVVVVLKEGLLGTEQPAGAWFTRDILPSMLAGEEAAAGLLHVAAAWSAMLSTEIDRHIGHAYRDAARTWLANFAGAWVATVAKAAVQAESSWQ